VFILYFALFLPHASFLLAVVASQNKYTEPETNISMRRDVIPTALILSPSGIPVYQTTWHHIKRFCVDIFAIIS
jgi:hypothetical protein